MKRFGELFQLGLEHGFIRLTIKSGDESPDGIVYLTPEHATVLAGNLDRMVNIHGQLASEIRGDIEVVEVGS